MKKKHTILLVILVVLLLLGLFILRYTAVSQPEELPLTFQVRRPVRHTTVETVPESKTMEELPPNPVEQEVLSDTSEDFTPGDYLFCLKNADDLEMLRNWAMKRGLHVDGINQLGTLRMRLTEEDWETLCGTLPQIASQASLDVVYTLPEPPQVNVGGGDSLPFYGTYRDFLGVNAKNASRGQGVKIAVIDTAVLSHGDFEGLQISALSLDGKKIQPYSYTGDSHATSVLSILAGNANGITADASILSIPVVGNDGTTTAFDLATAIVLAVDNGADVISISLGGEGGNPALEAAVQYASEAGVIVVAAAGNDGVNQVSYPAAYEEVVAVGAVNRANQYMDFSNSGDGLDVVAPGVGLEAATVDDEWTLFSGTSAAVPCVSGVLANYLSSHPNDTAEDAVQWLETTSTDIGPLGLDDSSGQGSVDAWLLENHDVVGLTDAALTSMRVETTEDGQCQVVMNIQNTGTADLEAVNLVMQLGKMKETLELGALKAYESTDVVIPVEVSENASKVDIYGLVVLPNEEDLRPENQGIRATLNFVEE